MKTSNSPMQLTRAADYAVRVMVQLAAPRGDRRVSLHDLAHMTGAPKSFLSKVMQALTGTGLINSRRGKDGGFQIAPPGRAASVREVIEAIDGPIHLNICLIHGKSCSRKASCPAYPVWQHAQKAMLDVLSSASIATMAAQAPLARTKHPAGGAQPLR